MVPALCTLTEEAKVHRGEKWPTHLAGLPEIGDLVESASGKVLQVVSWRHCMVYPGHLRPSESPYPAVKVELGEVV